MLHFAHRTTLTPLIPQGAQVISTEAFNFLLGLIKTNSRIVTLSGAGISTESGIPDYRSPGRPPHRPVQHNEFVSALSVRRRYWARSMIGYGNVNLAVPNASHRALADLEREGIIRHHITQNVDGLLQKAGLYI